MSEYIARAIREMRRWARRRKVILIVIAHPTKLEYDARRKTYRKPTLYDVYGASAWYDKADVGIVLSRIGLKDEVEVDVQKIRFKDVGKVGSTTLRWSEGYARYESVVLV